MANSPLAEFLAPSRSLTRSVFWLLVAKTLAYLFSFALPILLVREMTQTDFGLYKQVFLIAKTLGAVLPLGFAMSAFYFLPHESRRKGEVAFNILIFHVVVGLIPCVLFTLKPGLLATLFQSPELVRYAPVVGPVILFSMASSFLEFVSIANGETALASIFVAGIYLSKTLLLLGAAVVFQSLEALIYAALIQGVIQTAVLLLYLKSRFPGFWRRFDASLMREQIAYAVPLGLAGLIYVIEMDLHNYVVSYRFGAAAYAIYAIGCLDIPLLGLIKESVGSVMIAQVNRLRNEGKSREILMLTARMVRKLSAVFLPAYFLLLVTGRDLISLLFTARYLESWPIFAINLALIPLGMIGNASDPVFRAYPEHRYFLLRTYCTMLVLLLIALWFGTGRFGLVGAVSAVVGVNLLQYLILASKVGDILEASWRDLRLFRDVGKLALASGLAGAAALVAQQLAPSMSLIFALALCAAVFGLVYALCVHVFAVLTPDEYRSLRHLIASVRVGEASLSSASLED